MDVVSHHPYPFRAPADTTPPRRKYVDFYNLTVLTKAIDATYLRGKRLWLTEYGFGTRPVPQYPYAFGTANQGPFIADAYRRAKANARVGLSSTTCCKTIPSGRPACSPRPARRSPAIRRSPAVRGDDPRRGTAGNGRDPGRAGTGVAGRDPCEHPAQGRRLVGHDQGGSHVG